MDEFHITFTSQKKTQEEKPKRKSKKRGKLHTYNEKLGKFDELPLIRTYKRIQFTHTIREIEQTKINSKFKI